MKNFKWGEYDYKPSVMGAGMAVPTICPICGLKRSSKGHQATRERCSRKLQVRMQKSRQGD